MTRINVTKSDIESGEPGCKWCPIGLAIMREFPDLPPDLLEVGTHAMTGRPEIKFVSEYFEMSGGAAAYLQAFDRGDEMAPKSFELDWRRNEFLSLEELGSERFSG